MSTVTPLPDWPLLDRDPARQPFPVVDAGSDAPDGAVMTFDDPGTPELWGTWERRGGTWIPVVSATR